MDVEPDEAFFEDDNSVLSDEDSQASTPEYDVEGAEVKG